jgi:hypothetical protein
MKSLPLIITFLPLIAFSLLARLLPHGDIGAAGLIAAACALLVMLASKPRWPPKILNAASFVVFLIVAILGFTLGKHDDSWLATWAGTGVALILGAIILLLIPVMPFTEQYARQQVPREKWASPVFRQIHRTLSAAWGIAIMAIGAARVGAEAIEKHTSSHHLAEILLGTVVPVGILYVMLRFSKTYPKQAARRAEQGAPAGPGQPSSAIPLQTTQPTQPGQAVPGQGTTGHDNQVSQDQGSTGTAQRRTRL